MFSNIHFFKASFTVLPLLLPVLEFITVKLTNYLYFGRLPKTVKVPQLMIVIVLKVSRYVVVVVICLIYVVL